MVITNTIAFKRKHGVSTKEGLSLTDIAKLSGMPRAALQEVYNRGTGAFKTAGPSRPNMTVQSWSFGRVYSFVMKRKTTFGGADKDIAEKYKL